MRAFGLLLLFAATLHANADADELRRGVTTIGRPGIPGPLALLDKDAFAIACARLGDGTSHPVVAGTSFGEGRVVAFGHGGYFGRGALREGQTAALVGNAVAWAGRGRKRVGVVGLPDLRAALADRGYMVSPVELARGALQGLHVVCLATPDLGGPRMEKELRAFVRRGGGLLIAGLLWGWKQLNPAATLETDYSPNQLLAPMGLIFADGYTKAILPVAGDWRASHAGRAVERFPDAAPGERAQLVSVIMSAYRALPDGEKAFRKRVRRLARGDAVVPTAARPVGKEDADTRLRLLVSHVENGRLPPQGIRPAPSAADFPGAVPADAPRVTRRVRIDPSVPGWASTGLYAPPGAVIRLKLPRRPDLVRFAARIGCHTDTLWGKHQWKRHPEVSRRYPVGPTTEIASEHGGLLYLEVPERTKAGPFDLEVSGAVEAPWFVLGRTEPAAWRKSIRRRRAPWAELQNGKVVLTVRSEDARRLEDPTALLEYWSDVLDLYAELGERPLAKRPQRMVPDRQISAGWMHSGYPIMMQLLHSDMVTDLEKLKSRDATKSPAWGLWHELGHNHQRPEWTFGGTVEVTCNLFSLYVIDRMRGVAPHRNAWPLGARSRALLYLKNPDFRNWKKSPGIALWTYILVQQEFGWEVFRKTFREYEALPASERPRTDEEKRDQWLRRLSRNAGRNLGPYFEAWGIPTSEEARAAVADLEPWMPEMMAR